MHFPSSCSGTIIPSSPLFSLSNLTKWDSVLHIPIGVVMYKAMHNPSRPVSVTLQTSTLSLSSGHGVHIPARPSVHLCPQRLALGTNGNQHLALGANGNQRLALGANGNQQRAFK